MNPSGWGTRASVEQNDAMAGIEAIRTALAISYKRTNESLIERFHTGALSSVDFVQCIKENNEQYVDMRVQLSVMSRIVNATT